MSTNEKTKTVSAFSGHFDVKNNNDVDKKVWTGMS
jgi:hypothetical protein